MARKVEDRLPWPCIPDSVVYVGKGDAHPTSITLKISIFTDYYKVCGTGVCEGSYS